jgi:hypothetical protein
MAASAEDEDQAGDGNTDYEKIVSRRGLHFDRTLTLERPTLSASRGRRAAKTVGSFFDR